MDQFVLIQELEVPVLGAKTLVYRHETSDCLVLITPLSNPLTSLDILVPFETTDDGGYDALTRISYIWRDNRWLSSFFEYHMSSQRWMDDDNGVACGVLQLLRRDG